MIKNLLFVVALSLACISGALGACEPDVSHWKKGGINDNEQQLAKEAFALLCSESPIDLVVSGDPSLVGRLEARWPSELEHPDITKRHKRINDRSKGKRLVLYRVIDIDGRTFKVGLVSSSGDKALDDVTLELFADMVNPGPFLLDDKPVRVFYVMPVTFRR